MEFKIKVDATRITNRLNRYKKRINSKREFANIIVRPIIEREIELNLRTQGRLAPGRLGWKELSPSRKKQRRLHGLDPEGPKLFGETEQLITAATNLRVSFHGDNMTFSPQTSDDNNLKKMAALNWGSRPSQKKNINVFGQGAKPTGHLPPRPYFFITKKAWDEIVRKARDFFYR